MAEEAQETTETPSDSGIIDAIDYIDPDEDSMDAQAAAEVAKAAEGEGGETDKEDKPAEAGATPIEVTTEPVTEEAKPTEPAKVEEVAPAPVEAAPVAEPAKAVEPVEAPKAAEPEAKPAPVVATADGDFDYSGARAEVVKNITERYQFNEEQIEQMATEPHLVMPKLAAEMYVDIYEAIYHGIVTTMPGLMRQTMNNDNGNREKEEAFYTAHPTIQEHIKNNPLEAKQLASIGKFWRDQNPEATREQAIAGIGRLAMASFNLNAVAAEPVAAPTPAPKAKLPRQPAAAVSGPSAVGPTTSKEAQDLFDVMAFEEEDY